jgi:hypothetical protein
MNGPEQMRAALATSRYPPVSRRRKNSNAAKANQDEPSPQIYSRQAGAGGLHIFRSPRKIGEGRGHFAIKQRFHFCSVENWL